MLQIDSNMSLGIEWDHRVLSEVALSEFLGWITQQTDDVKLEALNTMYIVEHDRSGFPPSFPLQIDVAGVQCRIRTTSCYDVGCARCGIGTPQQPGFGPGGKQGGYRFQWKGPWTVRSRVEPGYTPNEWRRHIFDPNFQPTNPGQSQ